MKIDSKKILGSLAFKTGLAIIIIEIIILSIIGFYNVERFSSEIEHRIEVQISTPGLLVNKGLLSYDAVSQRDTIEKLVGEELHKGMVIGNNGKIFNSMDPQDIGKSARDIGIDTSFIGSTDKIFRKDIAEGKTELVSIVPIYSVDGKSPFLYTYIAVGTQYMDKQKQDLTVFFILGSTICVVLTTVLILLLFNRLIFRKLTVLDKSAKSISQGNLGTKIDEGLKGGSDEISSLIKSFESMRESLQSQTAALEEYNIGLEKKVSERTAEIEKRDTELLVINRQLEDANVKLKSLDAQKDEFISLVAHELKTPLTSIQGFAQILADKEVFNDPEKNSHYVELIEKNANRLYNLVTDIVDSSRLNLGRLKFNIDIQDIYRIFKDIKDDMSLTISKKGLTPEFTIEENLPKVNADYERTMQILHNIISNSIKFTVQGVISLKVSKEGEFVKFTIKDTGQGIPEENKTSLFSRFYQVDSAMTRKVGGSGLGLSICKGLVEGMNGQIGFESEVGKGSTFHFTLPIAKII